uniref:Uncharacterized protein n=1 Tax=Molossus molossus TaxID=27622 RepID=A0A7J8DCM0_MOLMO|nr:hypothetical protein HJG59_009405 [Molossus molossus]
MISWHGHVRPPDPGGDGEPKPRQAADLPRRCGSKCVETLRTGGQDGRVFHLDNSSANVRHGQARCLHLGRNRGDDVIRKGSHAEDADGQPGDTENAHLCTSLHRCCPRMCAHSSGSRCGFSSPKQPLSKTHLEYPFSRKGDTA